MAISHSLFQTRHLHPGGTRTAVQIDRSTRRISIEGLTFNVADRLNNVRSDGDFSPRSRPNVRPVIAGTCGKFFLGQIAALTDAP